MNIKSIVTVKLKGVEWKAPVKGWEAFPPTTLDCALRLNTPNSSFSLLQVLLR